MGDVVRNMLGPAWGKALYIHGWENGCQAIGVVVLTMIKQRLFKVVYASCISFREVVEGGLCIVQGFGDSCCRGYQK